MADTRKKPRAALSKSRGRGSEDVPGDTELPGADPPAEPEAESIPEAESTAEADADTQDSPPAHVGTQDEMHVTTTQQDTTMETTAPIQAAHQTYDKILGTSREHVEKANQ